MYFLIGLGAILTFDEEGLSADGLVPKEGIDGEVKEARVSESPAAAMPQHMLKPFPQIHTQAPFTPLLLIRPVVTRSRLEDLQESKRYVIRSIIANKLHGVVCTRR